MEDESISFACEVNKVGVQVGWMKDGTLIVPTEGIRIESVGTLHKLVIDKAELQKAGEYTAFISQGVESSAELIVRGMLKSIIQYHRPFEYKNVLDIIENSF